MHTFVFVFVVFFLGDRPPLVDVFTTHDLASCRAAGPDIKAKLVQDVRVLDVEWACIEQKDKV